MKLVIAFAAHYFAFLSKTAWSADTTTREQSNRLRVFNKEDPSSYQSNSVIPGYEKVFQTLIDNSALEVTKTEIEEEKAVFDQEVEAFLGLLEGSMSMHTSDSPSDVPSDSPSMVPSSRPTNLRASSSPSASIGTAESSRPTVPIGVVFEEPSASPSISSSPSISPTLVPTSGPSVAPSSSPSDRPTPTPSSMPTSSPSISPSREPSTTPTLSPMPSLAPSSAPSLSQQPSISPTIADCGISSEQREEQILEILYNHSIRELVDDVNTPQGSATDWLLNDDGLRLCPDEEKILQRWVLAVIYFSTNGDAWFRCSGNQAAQDLCGFEEPFPGRQRFLSAVNECEWAGISCIDGCVTEIEFEENNLIGTIPEEIGHLSDLAIWGMERGGLTSTIPTSIAKLTNLIFLDLDFNQLSGSLSPELLSLVKLTQLDLNNNQLTGSINGIGVFPDMEFLQLHDNFFTGTVPTEVGLFSNLAAFTLHETAISGEMPQGVCDLLATNPLGGGVLSSLIADCSEPAPDIICNCCTDCRLNP